MRAQEFTPKSADEVWNYVKRIHPAEQQGGGFLERLIRQYPQYQLQSVPLSSLIIHDQESDDPDEEPEEDPYGRVQVVDPEYAGEVSVHNLDRNPIVVDAKGHILDGNHRAWAAAELLGRDTIKAWVPVESVTEEAFNGIDISLEIQKDDEYVDDEDYDNQVIYVTASSNGRELGHVLFAFDGEYLMPQDLEVDERYRGQGIAATMYDYVKSKGYKIRRSGQQTAAGTGFWARHKPGQNVWEQQGLTEIERAEPGIYTGGKEELPFTVDTKNMRRIRPLPGGSKFGYYVEGNVIYIVDPKKPREQRERPNDIVVAKLHLERASGELSQALPNLYQIETITVDEKYRRLGLARSLYGIALTILKYTLMAGSIQTAGGRRMWQMLYSIPGVEMFGVVDDYLINDKIAQAILKGGGRVIHQAPSEEIPGETDRVYAFPIRAGRNEIVSAIRGTRVYDDEGNGVSLIAKWTGR